jgi:hypothetical protein
MSTGRVAFAPLTSPQVEGERAARRSYITAYKESHPGMPCPASPKSIYRLAHLLDLPDLCRVALEHITLYLAPANVLFEYCGSLSSDYEDVKKVELDYLVDNWNAVKQESSTKTWKEMVCKGGFPNYATASIDLIMRLESKGPIKA